MSENTLPKTKSRKALNAFLIALAVTIVLSIINWGIITGWGGVRISRLTLIGNDGNRYSALMYVPKSATDTNPAPAAIFTHGGAGSGRNHESWCVEFARRGVICISVDNLGSGDSEWNAATPMGNNAVTDLFADYLVNLPMVDRSRLITGGHSLGGSQSYYVAVKYDAPVCLISNASRDQQGLDGKFYQGNMLVINGTADTRNPLEKFRQEITDNMRINGYEIEDETLVPGKLYGSFEEGNAHMLVEVKDQIHEAAFINKEHIRNLLDFTQNSITLPNPIDASSQIWPFKDAVGLAGMISFAAMMVLFAVMLTEEVPLFAAVKQPLPRNIGLRKVGLGISVVCAVLFPLIVLYTGGLGLVNFFGMKSENLTWMPVRFANIAIANVIGLNVLGLLTFILFIFTDGKKQKATLRDYGLTSEGKEGLDFALIGKAAVIALITVFVGWNYLSIQKNLFGTDFYCLFFGFKPFVWSKFSYGWHYYIAWIICFLMAAVGMNVERRLPSTGSEAKDTAIAMIVNIILAAGTITFMIFLQNRMQIAIGGTSTALGNWGTDITRIWGMPIGMAIGAGGNTYLYRKTGNIWLGAILMGIICANCALLYGQIQSFAL